MSEKATVTTMGEWGGAFSLLSSLMFDEPSDEVLSALADTTESLPSALAAWQPCCSVLAEARANGTFDQVCLDIDVDFARLFANASDTPVHPYESMYRNSEKLLMRDERDQVVAAYLDAARAVDDDRNLPEDHAGYELAFLADLCQAQSDNDVAVLHAFFSDHAGAWLGALGSDIARLAQTDFYRGLGMALSQTVAGFEDYLAEGGEAR